MNNDEQRDRIARQTAEYIAKGGRITVLNSEHIPNYKPRVTIGVMNGILGD